MGRRLAWVGETLISPNDLHDADIPVALAISGGGHYGVGCIVGP